MAGTGRFFHFYRGGLASRIPPDEGVAMSSVSDVDPPEAELRELRDLAADCARRGGGLALELRASGLGETQSKSSATDLVTRADREVEGLIKAILGKERPGDTVFGEEAGTIAGDSGLRWVIDPIDGTVNYYYRYAGWVVSVAVESSRGALAGAIYDPVNDDLYEAWKSGRARRNGQPLDAPLTRAVPEVIGQALVATGFGYQAGRRRSQAEVLVRVLPEIRDIRRGGAAAMDLCHLAAGRIDAYFEKGLHPWDYAAGMLIARESGCVVEILEETDGEAFLIGARTRAIFDQLRDLLLDAGAFVSIS